MDAETLRIAVVVLMTAAGLLFAVMLRRTWTQLDRSDLFVRIGVLLLMASTVAGVLGAHLRWPAEVRLAPLLVACVDLVIGLAMQVWKTRKRRRPPPPPPEM